MFTLIQRSVRYYFPTGTRTKPNFSYHANNFNRQSSKTNQTKNHPPLHQIWDFEILSVEGYMLTEAKDKIVHWGEVGKNILV